MRQKLSLLVVLCFLCLSVARAQTVIESESSIVFSDKTAQVEIVLENPGAAFNGRIELELLDSQNKIRASAAKNISLRRGARRTRSRCRSAIF
jgi:hypothetical protein